MKQVFVGPALEAVLATALGAVECLDKPIHQPELSNALLRAIGQPPTWPTAAPLFQPVGAPTSPNVLRLRRRVGHVKDLPTTSDLLRLLARCIADPILPCGSRFGISRERLFRELDRANVAIHVFDPRGLEGLALTTRSSVSSLAILWRQADLAVLPAYTGGRTIVNTNGLEAAVHELFEEMRSYYLLAFRRSADQDNSKRREVKVLVRQDGVSVRTRTGSYSQHPASPPLAPTSPLTGLLPRNDLPMRLALPVVFESDGSIDVPVLVSADLSGLGSQLSHDAPRLAAMVAVLSDRAKLLTSNRVDVGLNSATTTDVVAEVSRLKRIKPGNYEVRVSAAVEGTTTHASVFGYVSVPDLHDETLSLSSAIFERGSSEKVPTLRRAFTRDEAIAVAIQVHCAGASSTGDASVQVRILDSDGRVADEQRVIVPGCRAAAPMTVRFPLPLSRLAPGAHTLNVLATRGRDERRRDVPFDVR